MSYTLVIAIFAAIVQLGIIVRDELRLRTLREDFTVSQVQIDVLNARVHEQERLLRAAGAALQQRLAGPR